MVNKKEKKKRTIDQAVIICGGRGTRLMPYTKDTPKILVKVNKKPFIYYLLNQLEHQGIKNVLLLTGFEGKKIQYQINKLKKQFKLNMKCIQGEEKWDTGRRIWEAKNYLENNFLFLYSDNFTNFNLKNSLNIFHIYNTYILPYIPRQPPFMRIYDIIILYRV